MTGRIVIGTLLLAAGLEAQRISAESKPVPQAFRSRGAAVSVNVSVRAGNLPVAGLAVGDFALADNGVQQTIEVISVSSVPVDVTLVAQLSWNAGDRVDRLRADILEVARLLRPDDRLRLIAFGNHVVEMVPLGPISRRLEVGHLPTAGLASLNDALIAALLQKPDLDRRRLIVLIAAGNDNLSVVSARKVLNVASRADAVLHIVGLQDCLAKHYTLFSHGQQIGPTPRTVPAQRSAAALFCDPSAVDTLTGAAEATGGAAHAPTAFRGSMTNAFKKALEEFRSSYILSYQPRGVPGEGWHTIDVMLRRPGKYDVRARKGYFGG